MSQMRLGHNLRNELVAVEYRYREMLAAVSLLHPDVAEAQARVDQCAARVEELAARMRVERQTDRSTLPRTSTKEDLAAARLERRDAKAALTAAKESTRDERQPMLAELSSARRDAVKAVRAEFVEHGLFWATANAVTQNHDTAAKQIAEAWKAGRPAQRRFRRWDGTGTLYTQVMWQAGKPRRSPELLSSGEGPWRNVFQLSPWMHPDEWPRGRGPHRHGTVKVRVETGGDPIELPVVLHRPIPAEGDITDVRLTRRRIGAQFRLSVAVTVRLPSPAPKTTGDAVAVRIGWASVGDGWVRVARISSATGSLAPVPAGIADLVRANGPVVDLHASAEWRALLDRDDSIRSVRDELLDELRPHIVDALADESVAQAVGVTAADVSRWRAARRFAAIARLWPSEHPLAAKLEAWRLRDLHLWEYEAHERDQVIARRRDAWRVAAAWICSTAAVIALHDLDVSELRRTAPLGEEDTYEARQARRHVQAAAPGELRAAIEQAAQRRGIQVMHVREASEAPNE